MRRKSKAITLLESLIYIAIFGMIFTVMVQFVMGISESNLSANLKKELGKSVMFISEHMNDSFSRANFIDDANSIYINSMGKLRLTNISSTMEYSVVNNRLNFNINGVNNYLSPQEFNVTNFYLEKVIANSTTVGVKVSMTLQSNKKTNETLDMNTTFSIK